MLAHDLDVFLRPVPKTLTSAQVQQLSSVLPSYAACDAAARARIVTGLQTIDREYELVRSARARFQDLLAVWGVPTHQPILLPENDQPFWFRAGQPLANYQSQPALPGTAGVVIIGAGLTGASAAYHLAEAAVTDAQRIVVLDQGDPAGEASGRNGGNFELLPENSVGAYEGMSKERLDFLCRLYKSVPIEILRAESERQASLVLGIVLRNRDLLKNIILKEHIDCDFKPQGWLHIASTEEEEQGICEEVLLAAHHGQRIEIWPRKRIREEFGIASEYLGRFIPGDGTYHPFKYTCGLLQRALSAGVELYTRVRVRDVVSLSADRHLIITDRGTITARRVVVATNAFTSQLFPQLTGIRPRQSQILVTEHAEDRTRGRVVTCNQGPFFFNQPRNGARDGRAPLLLGGGADRPMKNPHSRRRSLRVHQLLLGLRDHCYPELRGCPPSAEWVGAMGFTPDELPAIGFLRKGVIVAAGFNGYGGSYTTAAGLAAAEMARSGSVPDWLPEDVFSPQRLLGTRPLFMTGTESLFRISASLCRQLRTVSRQISETLTLNGEFTGPAPVREQRTRRPRPTHASNGRIQPKELRAFASFQGFTAAELKRFCSFLRRRVVPRGTVVYAAGDPGTNCFVVVRGVVALSIEARGQQQSIAHLPAGSIFGQVSVIDGQAPPGGCVVEQDAILAELDRDVCTRMLQSRSTLATRLLTMLNTSLIDALRETDRELMRLKADEFQSTARH
jgi:glycine/D-amino acid oxidase-like deaminating enzyme